MALFMCSAYITQVWSHSPARGLCELHIGWGLLEPLDHNQHGAIVKLPGGLIKLHVFLHGEIDSRIDL